MCPWLVSLTCCLHLFTQKCTCPVESSVSTFQLLTLDSRCCIPFHNYLYHQLLTLDSSLDLIWVAQQHFVCFQQVLAWTQPYHGVALASQSSHTCGYLHLCLYCHPLLLSLPIRTLLIVVAIGSHHPHGCWLVINGAGGVTVNNARGGGQCLHPYCHNDHWCCCW